MYGHIQDLYGKIQLRKKDMTDLFGNADGIESITPMLQSICDDLQVTMHLPIHSFRVDETIGKGKDNAGQLITVTASILDCDCPYTSTQMSEDHYSATTAFSVSRAKVKDLMIEFDVPTDLDKSLIPTDAVEFSSSEKSITYRMPLLSDGLKDLAEAVIRYRVEHFVTTAPKYGCCSLYKECSDAKKCLHPNRFYATACQYKKNLDSGKIFYGENANV